MAGWIVGILAFIGLVAGWQTAGFFVGLLGEVLFGIFAGIQSYCRGMISVFLDQKELLEDIRDSVSKSQSSIEQAKVKGVKISA